MADPNNKNGAQYVVANALFTCQYGVTPAQLQVTQNQKLLAQNKLVATDKEVQFNPPAQTFGVCSMNPNKQAGQPCLYAQGKWNPTTLYQSNNTNIVTEDSEMLCTMFAGKIKTIFPGQVASVSAPQLKKMEMEFAPFLIWEVNSEQNAKDAKAKIPAFDVNIIKCKGKVSNKSQEKHIYVRNGERLTFDAVVETEDYKQYVSWIVGHKTACAEKNIPIYDWLPYEFYGGQFQMTFHHFGDFFVGGVGYSTSLYRNRVKGQTQSYSRKEPSKWNAMFFVHVIKNSTLGIAVSTSSRVSDSVHYVRPGEETLLTLKTSLDFDPKFDKVEWIVTQDDGMPCSDPIAYKDNGKTLGITPKNPETVYKVVAQLKELDKDGNEMDGILSQEQIVLHSYNEVYIKCSLLSSWLIHTEEAKKHFFNRMRPGNALKFEVQRVDGVADPGLKTVDWTIKDPNGTTCKMENSEYAYYLFQTPGDYVIEADLKDGKYRNGGLSFNIEDGDNDGKELSTVSSKDLKMAVSHTIKIENNRVISIGFGKSYPNNRLPNVTYPIKLKYLYGNDTTHSEMVGTSVSCNSSSVIVNGDKKGNFSFVAKNPGQYEFVAKVDSSSLDKELEEDIRILNGENEWKEQSGVKRGTASREVSNEQKASVSVSDYEIEWKFCDSEGERRIKEVARGMKFGVKGKVPVWGITDGQKSANRRVKIAISRYDAQSRFYITIPSQCFYADLDKYGNFSKLDFDVDSIMKSLGGGDTNVKLSFFVYEAPQIYVKGLSETPNHGLWKFDSLLTITNQFFYDGRFVEPDGSTMMAIKHYGDPVKVRLRLLNVQDRKLCLRIYENLMGNDNLVFETKNIDVNKDGFAEIDVPTDKDKIKAEDHEAEEVTKPRLFYFQLIKTESSWFFWENETTLFTYPSKPMDENLNGLDENTISNCQNDKTNVLSHPYNYFRQLKLMPAQEEENKYCSTIASMVPVMVGDGDEKSDEKQKNADGCPNCHEEAEDMEKRLSGAFRTARSENVKSAAETYTTYMHLLQMDTCWIKAHFFSQVFIETGGTLSPKAENFNYSVANLYYSGTFSKYNGKKDLCAKYGASLNPQNFVYKGKKFEKSWLGKVSPHTCDQRVLANETYNGKLGNSKTGDDGWNYRGRGMVQITGKGTYQAVQTILKGLGIECDIVDNPEQASSSVEMGILTSMAFFWYKTADLYRLCNGNGSSEDVENVSNKVGGKDPDCGLMINGVPCEKNHKGKQMAFEQIMKSAFDLNSCTWDPDSRGMVTYRIYEAGYVEKFIPKIITDENSYAFYYYDENGNCTKICTRTIIKSTLMIHDPNLYMKNEIPDAVSVWNYSEPGTDGGEVHIMQDGNKVVYHRKYKDNHKYKMYKSLNKETELIRMDEGSYKKFSFDLFGKTFSYTINPGTQRFYSNPDVFAYMIGIFAELLKSEINSWSGAGNVDIQNTGYPSISHSNGYAFDFRYSDLIDNDVVLMKAALKFKCASIVIGTKKYVGKRKALQTSDNKIRHNGGHEDHIHISVYGQNIKSNQPIMIYEQ